MTNPAAVESPTGVEPAHPDSAPGRRAPAGTEVAAVAGLEDLLEDDLLEEDLVVEEISIDGMCGVY